MPPESLVIAGYYGFGNAGDELILYSLIRRFRAEKPQILVTVLSKNPSETQSRYQVEGVSRWQPWAWIFPLLHASRFILGGGGLLQESTGPWNHFYYLSLVVIAKMFGCRTEIIAIGVDPIQSPANRFLTRFVLNRFTDAVSVRDEESRQALEKAGVSRLVVIERDPVFELKVELPARVSGRVALALSPGKNRWDESRKAAELCDRLAERLHLPIDLLVFFPHQDEIFARRVAASSAAVERVRIWQDPRDVLSWIPEYRLVLAARFHALVLAASGGIPFAGWGPQEKISALCRNEDKPYWNFEEAGNIDECVARIESQLST